MPLGASRKVFSHDECKKFPVTPILPPEDNGAQYLKAQSKVNYYAIAHNEVKTIFDEEGVDEVKLKKGTDHTITLKKLNENQMRSISPRITDDLRYQLGEWLVDNRKRIQDRKKLIDE